MRLILPILFVIIAGGLFFGLTTGLFAEIDDLRLEKNRVNNDLTEANALQERFNTLRNDASSIAQSERDQLALLLPDNVDTVDLLVKINSIGKSSAMVLSNVKIKVEETKSSKTKVGPQNNIAGLGTVTFNFGVSGSYGAFRQFLGNLERNFRLVDISAITFTSTEKEPYQYNIELKTYWLK